MGIENNCNSDATPNAKVKSSVTISSSQIRARATVKRLPKDNVQSLTDSCENYQVQNQNNFCPSDNSNAISSLSITTPNIISGSCNDKDENKSNVAITNDLNQQNSIQGNINNQTINNSYKVTQPRPPPRERRPDRAVYIPRARRSSQSTPPSSTVTASNSNVPTSPLSGNSQAPTFPSVTPQISPVKHKKSVIKSSLSLEEEKVQANHILSSDNSENSFVPSNTILSTPLSCEFLPKTATNSPKTAQPQVEQFNIINNSTICLKAVEPLTIMNHTNNRHHRKQKTAGRLIISSGTENTEKVDRDEKEFRRASQEINRSNRRIIKQSFQSDVLEIEENNSTNKPPALQIDEQKTSVNPDEDDWDAMFDDNGDCLDPKLLDELTLNVGKVNIETPKTDYKLYQSKQAVLNEEEFPHVLEVSNFPIEFKTQDLMMIFSAYKETGFDIKWVDDTHALAVFSSSRIAAEVLSMSHPFVKVKPLAEATNESRVKARKCSLQPYRPRPETCAALARRLVTTALGVRLKTAPEERENERRVLREAKERKLLAAKQRDEIWES